MTALIGAVVGGAIGAYHSYKTTGKVTLKSVVTGALIGGAVGLTLGAGASLALTGGLAASTAAVTSAAGSLASSAAGGLVAAGTSVANKASSAANNVVNALSKSKIAELGKSAVQKVVNSFKNVSVQKTTTSVVPQKVIGHYPEYVELSNKLGTKAFSVPDKIWNSMTKAEQWTANQKFLDRAIAKGSEFLLATPIDKVRMGSFYQKEIKYLISQGYKFNGIGTKLVK